MSLRQFIPPLSRACCWPLCCCGSRSVGCSTLLQCLLVDARRKIIRHRALILLGYFALARAVPTHQPTHRRARKKERKIYLLSFYLFVFSIFFELGPRARPPPAGGEGAGVRVACLASIGTRNPDLYLSSAVYPSTRGSQQVYALTLRFRHLWYWYFWLR